MKNQKNKTYALIFVLLAFSSALLVLSTNTANNTKAATSSNLLQYEWTSSGASPTRTLFSAGPAPSSPSILWKTKIPGVSGIGDMPVAFNGMVFVYDVAGTTFAIDAGTGSIVWEKPGVSGAMMKIDNTYMMIGKTCVKIADGSTVWVGPPGFAALQSNIEGAGYVPELKMFLDYSYGWNLPDPSKPPTLAWNLTSQQDVGHGYVVYGDGKLFVGGEDGFLRAFDAKTGNFIWKTPLTVTSSFIYGASYYEGKVVHGGLDNNMRAWDANTGKLLWTYNPHTWYGQWASATAVAYGMVYEHNQDNYLYAVNATTGELVWRSKGPGIGYSDIPCIADGKIYCQMGENQYRDFNTGQYAYSEYDCYNAYTGELIWSMPMENNAPFNLQCVAYGNLYVCPTISKGDPGVWTYPFGGAGSIGEVWCIGSQPKDWSMFMSDPQHSGEGAGPTNLALKWKFQTGGQVVSSPTIVNGVAYFGSLDSNIYAIDANTGVKKWNFTATYPIKSSVAVVNGKVYTGADDGNIYCLDATTGAKLWETPAGGVVRNLLGSGEYLSIAPPARSSPIVANSKVYVGALDGNFYCLDANNGAVLWKFTTQGPIMATPALADNAVYFSSSRGGYPIPGQGLGDIPPEANGDFYCLNANTGSVIWKKEIPYVLDRTFGFGNFLFAAPTVAEGMVFVRNGFLYTYALNATSGNTLWNYSGRFNAGTPFQTGGVLQINAPLYAYGRIYMNDYYGIVCINASDGTEIWYAWLSRENISPALAYAYGRVYTVSELGVLYVLDAFTGQKLSYYESGHQLHSAPSLYNGNLYVGSNDWNVYCFGEARLMGNNQPAPAVTSNPTPLSPASPTPAIPSPTQAVAPPSSAAPTTTYIAISAAIVIVVVAVAAVLVRKRRK